MPPAGVTSPRLCSSSAAFAASQEPSIFLGLPRQRFEGTDGVLPFQPPGRGCAGSGCAAAGSARLWCDKHHLFLKKPPSYFLLLRGSCSLTVYNKPGSDFSGLAASTCSAPAAPTAFSTFPTPQSPCLRLTRGGEENHIKRRENTPHTSITWGTCSSLGAPRAGSCPPGSAGQVSPVLPLQPPEGTLGFFCSGVLLLFVWPFFFFFGS